jgi:hypothetical protein
MKGQLIFEFIIAGLIFFIIIIYTINYLNFNVSDFRDKFYQNRLQSKAFQVSEILMSGQTNLSLTDDGSFNQSKIYMFNLTYCGDANYKKLAEAFYMYETTTFGILPNNIKIGLSIPESGVVLLDCGPANIPRLLNMTKAEVGRVGFYEGKIAKLGVTVW